MKIPSDFIMGAATAAYQIEGSNFGGCGKSHWDRFAANGGTLNSEDGSIACDHYHRMDEDLNLIADAGFDSYRFSFSWPRLFPEGDKNEQGFDFYDRLIDRLLEKGITPNATLYHWDLPDRFAQLGGWENKDIANWFAEYSANVSRKFGDRLTQLATINEPWCIAWLSHYLGHHAPGKQDIGCAGKAMHNILAAHGRAMTAMRSEGQQNLGIVLNMEYSEPASDTSLDIRAAKTYDGIYNRWFIEALTHGTYPADILEHLEPHLPNDWECDMAEISQPLDWVGLNYYTRSIHQDDGTDVFPFSKPVTGNLAKTSMGWEIYPEGLRFFLDRMATDYTKDLPLYVTENGMAGHEYLTNGQINDVDRINYISAHLEQVITAKNAGVPVKGYYSWSLLDNFEWAFGYSERFGLIHVDYETLERTPKRSFYWFKDLIDARNNYSASETD